MQSSFSLIEIKAKVTEAMQRLMQISREKDSVTQHYEGVLKQQSEEIKELQAAKDLENVKLKELKTPAQVRDKTEKYVSLLE